MKREPLFKTEVDLCAAFMEWVKAQGWTPYAETAGWDVLLVARDGTQVGVQAKLQFNLKVISQTVQGDQWNASTGPDFRAVLVPDGGYNDVCKALGITLIAARGPLTRKGYDFSPDLPGGPYSETCWHFTNHKKRHKLPSYVPDTPAGSSAPIQLTEWKIKALKIIAVLEIRGYVTREDFQRYHVDCRRWVNDPSWLKPGKELGQFVRGSDLIFDKSHPKVYKQVRADVEKELNGAMV